MRRCVWSASTRTCRGPSGSSPSSWTPSRRACASTRCCARHYPWKSRTHYQRLVARGDVLLDGKPSKASTRVRRGMRVVVQLPVDPLAPERETADDLVFLYEDDALAAIDKPSGMTVHPTGRIRHGTLINKLHARYRSESPDADVVPRLAHRLDKDTSGVVLIVKNRRVDALVTEQFTRRRGREDLPGARRGRPARRHRVAWTRR